MIQPVQPEVFDISSIDDFNTVALKVFRYQAQHCAVYKEFLNGLNKDPLLIEKVKSIPFLPIEFFKSKKVITSDCESDIIFSSSGTTGLITSRHYVADISWYVESFRKAFTLFYGNVTNYCVLALLPSYLERDGSSLIYMVNDLIKESKNSNSGFFLYNHNELYQKLRQQQQRGQPVLLIGVTFALLDFTDRYQMNFPELIVMETGGMKGRRKEMIREELHAELNKGFGTEQIHSEYGMTELLSQAYSKGEGLFRCPPWMSILVRDTNDPLTLLPYNKTGGLNVIDLANVNSCSFIATQDLGRLYPDHSFEVVGRFDNADIRGCNLLIA
jgi:phenylacetate-coenzyme A ligase PaaK-like adenylate-forming protein